MNEFDIIRHYFTRQPCRPEGLTLGIGDDAAVISVPEAHELVVAMDTLVSGVHFPDAAAAGDIGWKALAVNLSDLAAMGAEPRWATLSLTLPEADENWLADFSSGFFDLAAQYRMDLIGGDLCHGPLSITVQVHGLVPAGQALTRQGARPGDGIYVTGTLGDAAYALAEAVVTSPDHDYFFHRLARPQPRVVCGMALRGIATSAIDISDGLVSDLQHVLDASRVGANILAVSIPVSQPLNQALGEEEAVRVALTGGDDYELCLTAPVAEADRLRAIGDTHQVPVTQIGTIMPSPGLHIEGRNLEIPERGGGYRHFN